MRSMKFQTLFHPLLFLGIYLLSGCSDSITMDVANIRKAPSFADMEKFATTQTFTATKTPNIYVVFFDTLRPDLALAQQGALKAFYDSSLTFDVTYATGTATWYSMFSFWHSIPAFLTYDILPRQLASNIDYGSVYLKVLKQLGYSIDIYGYD